MNRVTHYAAILFSLVSVGFAKDAIPLPAFASTVPGNRMILEPFYPAGADDHRSGDSDFSHGYRMHRLFFNAVQQFKLGCKSGTSRDKDGVQHFEASKDRCFGYNHLCTAMLIHADEGWKAGCVYFGEQFPLDDLPLWRVVLHWDDSETSSEFGNWTVIATSPGPVGAGITSLRPNHPVRRAVSFTSASARRDSEFSNP